MDRAWLNMLNRQGRIDPEKALRNLRVVEHAVAISDASPRLKSLRTNRLKRERELREACLFCFGMAQRTGQPIWVHPIEDADFDFVAAWEVGGTRYFAPTQLKELVPQQNNQSATVQSIIDALVSYKVSQQLTVAIHFNRQGRFEPAKILIPPLQIAALWVFGAVSPDQSRWFLYGNVLEKATFSTFEYPALTADQDSS